MPGNPLSRRHDWTAFQEEGTQLTRTSPPQHCPFYALLLTSPFTSTLTTTLEELFLLSPLHLFLPAWLSRQLGNEKFFPSDIYGNFNEPKSPLFKFPFATPSNFIDRDFSTVIGEPTIRRSFSYVPIFKEMWFVRLCSYL